MAGWATVWLNAVWADLAVIGWVALGGGVGSALRYAIDLAVTARWRGTFPLGIFVVNVSGSLLLGLVLGGLPGWGPSVVTTMIGTGLLGGYTTFSTASHDTIRLIRSGHTVMALVYAVGTMLATVGAALLGLSVGSW